MVDELAPLHHHHRELLRVGVGGRVDRVADRAGARQLLVALPRRHRRPELARPIVPTEARFTCLGHTIVFLIQLIHHLFHLKMNQ